MASAPPSMPLCLVSPVIARAILPIAEQQMVNPSGRKIAFPRFRDLDAAMLGAELHTHSTWTDGKAAVAAVIQRATELGLASIAITEHVRHGSEEWFHRFADEVRAAAQAFPNMKVLVGCEAKALTNSGEPLAVLDVAQEVLDDCDIVLGSVHRFPDGSGGLLNFADLDAESMARTETELALGLICHAPIDVLAHPGGMYTRRHGVFPAELRRQIVSEAIARDVAVEINSRYLTDL